MNLECSTDYSMIGGALCYPCHTYPPFYTSFSHHSNLLGIWFVFGSRFSAASTSSDAECKGLSFVPFFTLHSTVYIFLRIATNLFHSGIYFSDD